MVAPQNLQTPGLEEPPWLTVLSVHAAEVTHPDFKAEDWEALFSTFTDYTVHVFLN
jgi:hypothetical protein